eukprot:6012759-Prymnesium_polylepis.1
MFSLLFVALAVQRDAPALLAAPSASLAGAAPALLSATAAEHVVAAERALTPTLRSKIDAVLERMPQLRARHNSSSTVEELRVDRAHRLLALAAAARRANEIRLLRFSEDAGGHNEALAAWGMMALVAASVSVVLYALVSLVNQRTREARPPAWELREYERTVVYKRHSWLRSFLVERLGLAILRRRPTRKRVQFAAGGVDAKASGDTAGAAVPPDDDDPDPFDVMRESVGC